MKPEQLKATRRAVPWDESSTYIKIHPSSKADPRTSASDDIHGARVQAWLADTVTTDQYSPAAPSGGHSGGQCLLDTALRCRIQLLRFAGRGNDRVLTAAVANIRLSCAGAGVKAPLRAHARRQADDQLRSLTLYKTKATR